MCYSFARKLLEESKIYRKQKIQINEATNAAHYSGKIAGSCDKRGKYTGRYYIMDTRGTQRRETTANWTEAHVTNAAHYGGKQLESVTNVGKFCYIQLVTDH